MWWFEALISTRPDGFRPAFSRYDACLAPSTDNSETGPVALSEIDRNLLERCLQRKSRGWEDFVDRFMGLIIHVINHTAQARSVRLAAEDRDDLCAEVFLNVIKNDFAILRHFRGQSSLATYLTVVTRRIVVKRMMQKSPSSPLREGGARQPTREPVDARAQPERRISDREEVERLMEGLADGESRIVRMYHLEGKSYHEISEAVGVSENSIGPILSRARSKMRHSRVDQTTG